MTKLEAFQQMVLSIATIRTTRGGRGDSMPAQCLEATLDLTESEIERALANHDGELFGAAEELVDWLMSTAGYRDPEPEPPEWYNEAAHTR